MSKRFGRNQKRRLQEQLAQAKTALQVEKSATARVSQPLEEIRILVDGDYGASQQAIYSQMSASLRYQSDPCGNANRELLAVLQFNSLKSYVYVNQNVFLRARPNQLHQLVEVVSKDLSHQLIRHLQKGLQEGCQ